MSQRWEKAGQTKRNIGAGTGSRPADRAKFAPPLLILVALHIVVGWVMPDSERTHRQPTFDTLQRENLFKYPPKQGSSYKILNEFVAPHIESFNALFDDSGLPSGDGKGRGLLSMGIEDIGERVIFDGARKDAGAWGNRMRSKSFAASRFILC